MKEKIESVEIWQLEPLHGSFNHTTKMACDLGRRYLLFQDSIKVRLERNQPHIGGIAFVSTSRVRQFH